MRGTPVSWFVVVLLLVLIDSTVPAIASRDKSATAISGRKSRNMLRNWDGVAVTTFLGSPRWFQNRYSMMVTNVMSILPDNWVVQIIHNDKKMAMEGIRYPGIQRYVAKETLFLTPLPAEMRRMKKKDILTTVWFWKHLLADRVLMFGGSGVFCSNSPLNLNFFHHFDYIGCPWKEFRGLAGDGGISLRNRHQMIDVINAKARDNSLAEINEMQPIGVGKEDSFFVKSLLMNSTLKVATSDDTAMFGLNDVRAIGEPLVAQGILGSLNETSRIHLIEYCPELKLLYPVLQSPHCFGANPQALDCFQSLCQFGGLKCSGLETRTWFTKSGSSATLSIRVE